MKKYLIYAMEGQEMCFLHVLMNAKDLMARGHEVKVIIEGAACKLPSILVQKGNPLFSALSQDGTIAGVCEACSRVLGVYDENTKLELTMLSDMQGHAGMAPYVSEGYEVIVF